MNQYGMLKRFCGAWMLYWIIYWVQPVHSIYPGIPEAFLLQISFVTITAAFYLIGVSGSGGTAALVPSGIFDPQYAKFVIKSGIVISVIGLSFLLYDKVGVQEIDYSQGLAIARQEWRVLGEERSSAASSIFSVLGYLFGGAYFLSLALAVSEVTPLTDKQRFFYIFISLLIIILNSAITGGRSSILLAIVFCCFGYFTRINIDRSGLFVSTKYNIYFKILLSFGGIYVLYIFYLRALASDQFVGAYSLYFLEYLGLAPSEWFARIAYETSWGEGLALLNLSVSYLTHSMTTTAAILQTTDQTGDVLFVNFMQIGSKFGLFAQPTEWFLAGRFASLPGALYLQYGLIGTVIGSAFLGMAAGAMAKKFSLQPTRFLFFFFCSIIELILLMSPFLFAGEFLFFPSVVIGGFLIIALAKVVRARNA